MIARVVVFSGLLLALAVATAHADEPAIDQRSGTARAQAQSPAPNVVTNAPQAVATEAYDFGDAILDSTPSLDARYRYESVQQDGLPHDAEASTLRTRVGVQTQEYDGLRVLLQGENIAELGPERYSDTFNNRTTYPIVADPNATQLYQGYVAWQPTTNTDFLLGRQAIALDNERFVGINDWRQAGTTLDAVTAKASPADNLNLMYSYVFGANRIYTENSPMGQYASRSHLLNANIQAAPWLKVSAYSYLLDLEDAPTFSSATTGLRGEGKYALNPDVQLVYAAEFAHQNDYAGNPTSYDQNYYLAEPGLAVGPVSGKLGYELLGGNGREAVQEPLGTHHPFNGYADKFLVTPAGGLEDKYAVLGYTRPAKSEAFSESLVKLFYHDFHSDAGDVHYGHEYDLWAAQTFYQHYTMGFQYADYRADKLFTNTRKAMLVLQVKY